MKVFLPQSSSEQLEIPRYFVKNFNGLIKEEFKLKGPDGKLWDVDVEGKNGGVFIKNGWAAFANHYWLRLGEFLIFKHEGDSLFSVKIFRGNGCKAEIARVKTEVLDEEEIEIEAEQSRSSKRPCNAQKDSEKAHKLKRKASKRR